MKFEKVLPSGLSMLTLGASSLGIRSLGVTSLGVISLAITSTAAFSQENTVSAPSFGGPSSVAKQVEQDNHKNKNTFHFSGISKSIQPYYDFKQTLKDDYNLSVGGDYNTLFQNSNSDVENNDASGGIVRLYGTWTAFESTLADGRKDTGSLVVKFENRHAYSDISPQQLASEIGYVGLTAVTYSDAGSLLTNFYWQQTFQGDKYAFVAGVVDATDYLDVAGLVNPWTNFNNLDYSTNPTIPTPNQGLGASFRAKMGSNYYLMLGFADTNGDPSDFSGSIDIFFDDKEYFKHIELGWYSDWDDRFSNNIHVTLWQADERKAQNVAKGWGGVLSYSDKINDNWLPFLKLGYADGGGSMLEKSVSGGVGYYANEKNDVLGIGLSYGKPSEKTFNAKLDSQFTAEVFYRFQLTPHVTVTPDIQFINNPALNLTEDNVVVFGLRARINL